MNQISRIVVGLDASPNARRAAQWAAGLAQTTGAHVVAVHARSSIEVFEVVDHATTADEQQLTINLRDAAAASPGKPDPVVVVSAPPRSDPANR